VDSVAGAEDIRAQISAILVEELEIEPDELFPTADFVDEYGADSLTVLAVVARMERELGITIPVEEASAMTTVDNVLALAGRHRTPAAHHA
jgi:acyl carrier protein